MSNIQEHAVLFCIAAVWTCAELASTRVINVLLLSSHFHIAEDIGVIKQTWNVQDAAFSSSLCRGMRGISPMRYSTYQKHTQRRKIERHCAPAVLEHGQLQTYSYTIVSAVGQG